jgi:uncharacterized membrane protein (TIGR02234 family)
MSDRNPDAQPDGDPAETGGPAADHPAQSDRRGPEQTGATPPRPGTETPGGASEVTGPVPGPEATEADAEPDASTSGTPHRPVPERPATRRSSTRGQLVVAVVACTLGAGIALYAASKNWSVQPGRPLGPLHLQQTGRTGTEITPVVPTLALISLAGAGALVATRRIGRFLVGVLLVLAGLGVAAGAGYGLSAAAHDPGSVTPGWAITALAGGLLVAVVGLGTARRGRSWPTMGSRYERPAARAARAARVGADDDAAKIWDAIDDGNDPTVR